MKLLITGGSGLLALNWALATRGRYAVTLGLHDRNISITGAQTQVIDLESVDNLVRSFESEQPQIVIHTAGLTSVEKCQADPELARRLNVVLAANVAHACAMTGVSFVHISTDHLFSGEKALVDETSPITPVNVYGQTKAEAELRVLDICPQSLVIRTNFYGWGTSYRSSFSDTIIKTLRAGKTMTLFEDVFYTPILVETLVHTVHDLVDIKANGICHVVGDERISKYEFGQKIASKFSLDAELIDAGRISDQAFLVQRPHDMSLSNHKVCKLLGRNLGSTNQHLTRLFEQEQNPMYRKLETL